MIGGLVKLGMANPVTAPWVVGLQAAWPLIWRVAFCALLVFVGWRYGAQHERNVIADERVKMAEAMVEGMEQVRRDEAAAEQRSDESEQLYEQSKTELERVRADIPTRVVRLCVAAANRGAVPRVPDAAAKHDGAAADAADDARADRPLAAGRDIGRELYALADECDADKRRLSALQHWTTTVPSSAQRAP